MSIKVICPSCGKALKAKESIIGKHVKCPQCGDPVLVALPKAPKKPKKEDFGDSIDFGGFDPNEGVAVQDRKPCPACGELIVKGAAKCRFCGEILDKKLRKPVIAREEKPRYSSDPDDEIAALEWVMILMCSGIGCIYGIICMIQGKPKGIKIAGLSILVAIIVAIVRVGIMVAQR